MRGTKIAMLTSVITVVKNHVAGLRGTFVSLEEQSHSNWEMIIVVGPSRDESLNYAIKLAQNDTRIKVVQQQSNGIYGAMNEGIEVSVGETIWFMNAGDCFASPGVIEDALLEFTSSQAGLLIGGYKIQNFPQRTRAMGRTKKVGLLSFAFNRKSGCHQAMVFKASTIKATHGYNTSYELASDFELILRVIKGNLCLKVPILVASIEPGGVADQNLKVVFREKHQIRSVIFNHNKFIELASWTWTALAVLKMRNCGNRG